MAMPRTFEQRRADALVFLVSGGSPAVQQAASPNHGVGGHGTVVCPEAEDTDPSQQLRPAGGGEVAPPDRPGCSRPVGSDVGPGRREVRASAPTARSILEVAADQVEGGEDVLERQLPRGGPSVPEGGEGGA